MEEDREFRRYRAVYSALSVPLALFHPVKIVGRENVPEGAALVCAGHSSNWDPLIMAAALSRREHLCFMAKAELFRGRLLGGILRGIGTFPVDRGKADLAAIGTALRCLKNGKKVGIFPEGTRAAAEGEVRPKSGVIRIAEKAGVPVLPVFIPRKKPLFRRLTIVVGRPYRVGAEGRKLTREELEAGADALMETIRALGGEGGRG